MDKFLTALFGRCKKPDKTYVLWGGLESPHLFTVEEVLDNVASPSTKEHCFFSPVVRTAENTQKKSGCVSGCVAWLEKDVPKPGEQWPEPLLPPSIRVMSGKGEHWYWLLDKEYNAGVIEATNKAISRHMREKEVSDQGCWNMNRVLRVPGSFNFKYEPALPVFVQSLDNTLIYSAEQLQLLRPYPQDLLELGINDKGEQHESARDYRLAVTLLRWGLDRDMVALSLVTHSSKAASRPDYVDITIENAAKSLEQPEDEDEDGSGQLGNFSIMPLARLVGVSGEEIGLRVQVSWNSHHSVESNATALEFTSRANCAVWLSKIAPNRVILATDKYLRKLWVALEKTCPNKEMLVVDAGGRYDIGERPLYIYGPGRNDILSESPLSVCWQSIVPDNSAHLSIKSGEVTDAELSQRIKLLLAAQPVTVTYPTLGWLTATLFVTLFRRARVQFPTLVVYGAAESGKTTYLQNMLLPLIGMFCSPVSADITPHAMVASLSTATWPAWFDEWRATNRNAVLFQDILRQAYNSGLYQKGRSDQSVASYKLVAPVLVSGESPLSDGANQDRSISVVMNNTILRGDNPYTAAYKQLRAWDEDKLKAMSHHFIQWSLQLGIAEVSDRLGRAREVFEKRVGAKRASSNIAVIYAGWLLFLDYCKSFGLELPTDIAPFEKAVYNTHLAGLGSRTATDELVSRLTYLFASIPELRMDFDEKENVLWFSPVIVHHILRLQTDLEMLKLQLAERTQTYLQGPMKRDGGLYYGIDLDKALELGLDVCVPDSLIFNFAEKIRI